MSDVTIFLYLVNDKLRTWTFSRLFRVFNCWLVCQIHSHGHYQGIFRFCRQMECLKFIKKRKIQDELVILDIESFFMVIFADISSEICSPKQINVRPFNHKLPNLNHFTWVIWRTVSLFNKGLNKNIRLDFNIQGTKVKFIDLTRGKEIAVEILFSFQIRW